MLVGVFLLQSFSMRWSKEKVWQWYRHVGWQCGFNYLPRTAVNYLDFWQAFDEQTIEQELGWAEQVGFNSIRIVLSYTVWQADPAQFQQKFARFLDICAKFGLRLMPCLLDDCGFSGQPPILGPQSSPVAGVHNSRAVASPGRSHVMDKTRWPRIQSYVQNLVESFADDGRILMWDLYNEPGNRMIFSARGESLYDAGLEAYSHELMRNLFDWVRGINPVQPLTVAGWQLPPSWENSDHNLYTHPIDLDAFALSDIVSFHAYCKPDRLRRVLDNLSAFERPLFCTEWMARQAGSRIVDQLPVFARRNVSSYQWGLVKGLTQTHIPWPALLEQMSAEEIAEEVWFHDLLYPNGAPYDEHEISLIAKYVQEASGRHD